MAAKNLYHRIRDSDLEVVIKNIAYHSCTYGNSQFQFFIVWMSCHVVLLELVSESCWPIEECGLDKVDKTWVMINLNIGN